MYSKHLFNNVKTIQDGVKYQYFNLKILNIIIFYFVLHVLHTLLNTNVYKIFFILFFSYSREIGWKKDKVVVFNIIYLPASEVADVYKTPTYLLESFKNIHIITLNRYLII